MLHAAHTRSVSLRPHVKTHKTLEATYYQLFGSPTPPKSATAADFKIVASTLGEARFYAEQGFADVLYGVPIVVSKLDACATIATLAPLFSVLIDSVSALSALEQHAIASKGKVGNDVAWKWRVFVDVDPGYHRSGVQPCSSEAIDLVQRILHSPHLIFRGIYTHAGHSYLCKNAAELAQAAEEERDVLTAFAVRIRTELGLVRGSFTVSMGSTPTCSHLPAEMCDVTEIHPGNYVFYDRTQALLGSCSLSDCAATVLATVLAHYHDTCRLLIDAGALALSKDQGCTHLEHCRGWAAVIGHSHLILVSITQELGVIQVPDMDSDAVFASLPVGSHIQLVPNHSCLTAACFGEYYVVADEHSSTIEAMWHTVPRQW